MELIKKRRMKKLILILTGALMCVFFVSCKAATEEAANNISLTIENNVEEADFWILPQTVKNVKTTVWGTPTVSKMKSGERKTVSVPDGEKYIVRVIDSQSAYYAANEVVLANNNTLRFQTSGSKYDAALAVIDENGNTVSTKENVFEGALGAN